MRGANNSLSPKRAIAFDRGVRASRRARHDRRDARRKTLDQRSAVVTVAATMHVSILRIQFEVAGMTMFATFLKMYAVYVRLSTKRAWRLPREVFFARASENLFFGFLFFPFSLTAS